MNLTAVLKWQEDIKPYLFRIFHRNHRENMLIKTNFPELSHQGRILSGFSAS